jgi:ADP-ribose pyrophosphatase
MEPGEEHKLSTKKIYQGRKITLRLDTIQKKDGKIISREIVEYPDSVAAVALDDEGNIFLVRQLRRAIGQALLEIPAGGIDPGESPEDAACRELREEIGFHPQKLNRMGGFYLSPGYSTEYMHLFLATHLTFSPLKASDTADIEVVQVSLAQAYSLISSGEIRDAKSVAALLLAKEHLAP